MKAITENQPWATLIVEGVDINGDTLFKNIENRTWKTNFRGRVLIHAGAKSWPWCKFTAYLFNSNPFVYRMFPKTKKWLDYLPTAAIIGSVEIVDCVINHPSIWAEKTTICKNTESDSENYDYKTVYNWVLANPILFDKPIPCKGKLSFWEYNGVLPEKY